MNANLKKGFGAFSRFCKNSSKNEGKLHKSYAGDSQEGIVRTTSIISLGTLSSRILGFIRDIILARLLGTAASADAFFVAFRIPNLFRDIVGEGAVNSTVVPVFSEYVAKKDRTEFLNLVNVLLISSLMVLSCITILGIAFAPLIVRGIAPGFIGNAEKLMLTIRLTRVMFPYLVFIGLTAYSIGILYTCRSFVAPAFSPCLLNIAVIASTIISSRTMQEPVFGLAVGVLVGGAAQLLLQVRPLRRNGMRLKRPKTLLHPGAKKVGRLLIPRLFGTAVYQLNVFVDTFCASLSFIIGAGGISAIYYANRIIQFPMGVFSIALASAILPTLSGFAAKNLMDDFKKTLIFSLKNVFLIMLPISVFTVFLATPIIRVLFERGAFGAYSTKITSWALLFYALGLVSFGGIKIMVTAFHSLQDTKTPARVAGICLVINVVLNFVLMRPLKVGGIALASSIAATVNFLILFFIMNRRLGDIGTDILRYIVRVGLAVGVMAYVLLWAQSNLSVSTEILRLIYQGAVGFIAFIAACILFKVDQIEEVVRWILKRR